ncbi:MAG: PAS domain-containing protein, partial [Candidatus Odinarchaeota archaeon]
IPESERNKVAEETVKRSRGNSSTYETLLKTKHAQLLPVLVHASPLFTRDKIFRGVLVVFTDISSIKQVEEALKEEKKKYLALFHETPVGIFTCDTGGTIQSINKTALQLLGSPSETATRQINILTFPPLQEAGFSADFERCIDQRVPISAETPYTTKWGKCGHYRYKLIPLLDETGTPEGVLCTFDDILEHKQLE